MRFVLVSLILACAANVSIAAQPESENVGHTRHHHPHNPKHETTSDPARFYTDRESPVQIPLPKEKDAFSFVVYGDRTGGPDEGVSILADAVRDTNLLEPDMVMTVGDLIQGYNETEQWMTQMREYRAIMDKLICPWFPVAGNHDTYWRYKGTEERPENEHDGLFEMHFGPLWYAFEHKNNYFIVLYTDEGNPETGEKNFGKPASQKMSPEQRAFLAEALERGKDSDHIFVFLHHPRWLKGGYGDDWDSVHQMLVEAGNVAAVFAGHIHYMRHDGMRDGIEYVSLATTGGHQNGTVPQAGFLHHYHVVTVRKSQIAMATIPVGEIMDPRDITGELATQSRQLAETLPPISPVLSFASDGSVDAYVEATVRNSTDFPMSFTLSARSWDSRWIFPMDHHHGSLKAGEEATLGFRVLRQPGEIDSTFRIPELVLERELMTPSFRYAIPTKQIAMPLNPAQLPRPPLPMRESVLRTGAGGDGDVVKIPDDSFTLPQGAFTLECWFNADAYQNRTGLVAKTENSDYGIFVNNGRPSFSVRLGERYTTASAPQPLLETGRWHHIAGVYDGAQVRLYVDGQLVGEAQGSGKRQTNSLPLYIGADVNGDGAPTSAFSGRIDEVRLSKIARYSADSFTPARWHKGDDKTVLLYHMDGRLGPWIFDDSPSHAHGWVLGGASVLEE